MGQPFGNPNASFNASYANAETRCHLCDHRVDALGNRHDPRCPAGSLPRWLCTWTAGTMSPYTKGFVLDCSLHYREALGPLPETIERAPTGNECPCCAAPVVSAFVPVGRRLHTELGFVEHVVGCPLTLVPASGVAGLYLSLRAVPEALVKALPVGVWSPSNGVRDVRAAASVVAAAVPEGDRCCALCAGRLHGPGGGPVHRARCAARSVADVSRALTAGDLLDSTSRYSAT